MLPLLLPGLPACRISPHLILPLLPLLPMPACLPATVLLSAMFLGDKPSLPVVLTLLPIIGGVALASTSELSFNWKGFLSGAGLVCVCGGDGVCGGGERQDACTCVPRPTSHAPFACLYFPPRCSHGQQPDVPVAQRAQQEVHEQGCVGGCGGRGEGGARLQLGGAAVGFAVDAHVHCAAPAGIHSLTL